MKQVSSSWCVRPLLWTMLAFMAPVSWAAHPPLFPTTVANHPTIAAQQTTPQNAAKAGDSGGAQVVMKAMSFQPAALNVRAGETVVFRNEDIFAHTVTADDGSFDSGLIQPGESWKITMPKTASLAYHCRPHPNMKAKLVEQAEPASAGKQAASQGLPGFNPPSKPQEFHPILVNFTAALLPLAFLSDLLGRFFKRASLNNAAAWMVLYAAAITPLTGIAGWWWKSTLHGSLPPEIIAVHQWLGTAMVLVLIALAAWRWKIQKRGEVPGAAYLVVTAIAVLALVYQGSLGGLMVFGK